MLPLDSSNRHRGPPSHHRQPADRIPGGVQYVQQACNLVRPCHRRRRVRLPRYSPTASPALRPHLEHPPLRSGPACRDSRPTSTSSSSSAASSSSASASSLSRWRGSRSCSRTRAKREGPRLYPGVLLRRRRHGGGGGQPGGDLATRRFSRPSAAVGYEAWRYTRAARASGLTRRSLIPIRPSFRNPRVARRNGGWNAQAG